MVLQRTKGASRSSLAQENTGATRTCGGPPLSENGPPPRSSTFRNGSSSGNPRAASRLSGSAATSGPLGPLEDHFGALGGGKVGVGDEGGTGRGEARAPAAGAGDCGG